MLAMPDDFTITARWVFPVVCPPLEKGVITISDGRVIAAAKNGRAIPDLDLGNVAIVPGFVNSHTHLDLTGARGTTPPSPDFAAWLRTVIAYRKSRSLDHLECDIRAGIAACVRHGTTLIGDIAADGSSLAELATAPLRAVVFRELIGLSDERGRQALTDAANWLSCHRDSVQCHRGLSPHAPYSASASVVSAAARLGVPIATHVAETAAELELLRSHRGPFLEFLQALGAWDDRGIARSVEEAIEAMNAAPTSLIVHANFLAPESTIAPNASIVYCPRTHAAFGHPPHPFREFLARGVRVALGTDSLASNPDLSLLAEARFVASRHPDLDRATLLRMATLSGAEALGWDHEAGSLEPGKSADFAVVSLPNRDATDPHDLLFDSELDVQSTWFRGKCVYDALPPGRG